MGVFRRFLSLGLISLLCTLGFAGGLTLRPQAWAYQGEPTSQPAAMDQTPDLAGAADLEPIDAGVETGDASSPAEAETLNLPDFEPRLPAESLEPQDRMGDRLDPQSLSLETAIDIPKLSRRQQLLITADEYYLAGAYAEAEDIYRQVKTDLWLPDTLPARPEPILDVADLPPGGAVYWREANQGIELGLAHRTRVPLQLLVDNYPEFIPGQALYGRYLMEQGELEAADAALDSALLLYPSQPDLLKTRVEVQMALEQWIEASITARQFTILNPDHADVAAMAALAESNLDRFRGEMNAQLTQNFIGNLITGTAGFVLTGGLFGPFTAVNSAMILMQGEDAIGEQVAEQVKDQLPLLQDAEVTEYVNLMGHDLARLSGRDEFDYDFYVLDDDALNAFALPGGKIFINSGAILKTHSEAELAGLVAHEISHAVLSHGFQMATNSNLLSSLASFIPIPEIANVAAGLAITGYSRQMERQADVLGTQLLATAGYAADGLHNLMVILEAEVGDRAGIQWFSTHPAPDERVAYLQRIVEAGGYNRYAYEGVAPHLAAQARILALQTKRRHQGSSPASESVLDPRP
ncbi:MAG: M48 family metallopeptidase [Leptolyngbyaceae cyanobacterium]